MVRMPPPSWISLFHPDHPDSKNQHPTSPLFVFFTGVSKFSRVSIFSELNNLEDLAMVEDYAAMLGYSQEELEQYFGGYISAMAEKQGISEPDAFIWVGRHFLQ